jgi:hypothetical protein
MLTQEHQDLGTALVTAQQAVKELGRLMEVNLEVPQRLQDVPSFVRAATNTKNLPGSPWVVANMQGELDDLMTAVSRCVVRSKSE